MEEHKKWLKTEKEKNKKQHQTQAEDKTVALSMSKKNNNMMRIGTTKFRQAEEVKLAALAAHLKAQLKSANMPITMQESALSFTSSFLDANSTTRLNPGHLAFALKKEFDARYGAAWHCIVGKSYGSYVTHSSGGFLYFSFESISVLLFQTKVHLLNSH